MKKQEGKEEVLALEKTIKDQQLAAANVDLLIKEAQLELVQEDISLKNIEIQRKKEAMQNSKAIEDKKLIIQEKELEIKLWEHAEKYKIYLQNYLFIFVNLFL